MKIQVQIHKVICGLIHLNWYIENRKARRDNRYEFTTNYKRNILGYGDGADNAVEKSSIFSIIPMR